MAALGNVRVFRVIDQAPIMHMDDAILRIFHKIKTGIRRSVLLSLSRLRLNKVSIDAISVRSYIKIVQNFLFSFFFFSFACYVT
jgi:hypothetical protein